MDVNRKEINIVKTHCIDPRAIKRKVPGSSDHSKWKTRGIVLFSLAKRTLIKFVKEFPALLDSF